MAALHLHAAVPAAGLHGLRRFPANCTSACFVAMPTSSSGVSCGICTRPTPRLPGAWTAAMSSSCCWRAALGPAKRRARQCSCLSATLLRCSIRTQELLTTSPSELYIVSDEGKPEIDGGADVKVKDQILSLAAVETRRASRRLLL